MLSPEIEKIKKMGISYLNLARDNKEILLGFFNGILWTGALFSKIMACHFLYK
jgi:hypothetical protein